MANTCAVVDAYINTIDAAAAMAFTEFALA